MENMDTVGAFGEAGAALKALGMDGFVLADGLAAIARAQVAHPDVDLLAILRKMAASRDIVQNGPIWSVGILRGMEFLPVADLARLAGTEEAIFVEPSADYYLQTSAKTLLMNMTDVPSHSVKFTSGPRAGACHDACVWSYAVIYGRSVVVGPHRTLEITWAELAKAVGCADSAAKKAVRLLEAAGNLRVDRTRKSVSLWLRYPPAMAVELVASLDES